MPTILSTELTTWRVVARRWRRGNRGREASVLPREERLASLAARGAYIESQWHQVYRAPDIPADWCRTCAQWTTSWCEGCYSRCGRGGEPFGAICHQCDSEKRVCDKCTTQGISWDQGHERYVAYVKEQAAKMAKTQTLFELLLQDFLDLHGGIGGLPNPASRRHQDATPQGVCHAGC